MDKANIRVVSAEIQREGCYLITQRLPQAVLPGLWEFPGGRVRDGESDAVALTRSLELRLGVTPQVVDQVLEVTHEYDDYSVTLAVYRCSVGAEPTSNRVAALAWVRAEDLAGYEFPGADQRTVQLLLSDDR